MGTYCRPVVSGGAGGAMPWHHQINLSEPYLNQGGGEDYAHHILLAAPDFQTFLRPCTRPGKRRSLPSSLVLGMA
jgi:hypothetical protein